MPKIHSQKLPSDALLNHYSKDGFHTDCYVTDIPFSVTHEQFVLAFYTTWLFKLERLILKMALSLPSSDEQAAALASSELDKFAAWSVEDRCSNQLLMSDFKGRTRSWLMIMDMEDMDPPGTKLFFGSAVVPVQNKQAGKKGLGLVYKLLVGFHRLYSVALLSSAATRLIKLHSN